MLQKIENLLPKKKHIGKLDKINKLVIRSLEQTSTLRSKQGRDQELGARENQ